MVRKEKGLVGLHVELKNDVSLGCDPMTCNASSNSLKQRMLFFLKHARGEGRTTPF